LPLSIFVSFLKAYNCAILNGNLVRTSFVQESILLVELFRLLFEATLLLDGMAEAEAKLQTKTEEVDSVQKELKAAGKSVATLMAELSTVKAELAERTTEVITLNQHLEAHAGATARLKREVDELKAANKLALKSIEKYRQEFGPLPEAA